MSTQPSRGLMISLGWFFLYTPLPWLAAMYVGAYRHDLRRLARPVRDRAGRQEWWSACAYLGLIGADTMKPKKRPWRSPLAIATVLSASISSFWIVIPVTLAWFHLVLLQAVAAVPLFLALARVIGPTPFRPFRDVLPFPRLGTRVRHLDGPKRTDNSLAERRVGSASPGNESVSST